MGHVLLILTPLVAGKAGNGLYVAKTGAKLLPGRKCKDDRNEADDDSEESVGVRVHLLHKLWELKG